MKRLSFGTLLTLLSQACKSGGKPQFKNVWIDLCKIYSYNTESDLVVDNSYTGHIASCKNAPKQYFIDAVENSDINQMAEGFRESIIPKIRGDRHKALYRAIKKVIEEDETLQDDTVIGYQKTKGYTKGEICSACDIDEAYFLANVFFYTTVYIRYSGNDPEMMDAVKELRNPDFIDRFIDSDIPICFIDSSQEKIIAKSLERQFTDENFDDVFSKIADIEVSEEGNPATVEIYHTYFKNCELNFAALKELVSENITHYVLSRYEMKGKKPEVSGSAAMKTLLLKYGGETDDETLKNASGEILLYMFLEAVLNAPKLMSRIEIDKKGIKSSSAGVHLVTGGKLGVRFSQLVFGVSDILGDLEEAVDQAFEKIRKIKENEDKEWGMIINDSEWELCGEETRNYITNLVIPKKKGGYQAETAFGIFIGYTLKIGKVASSDFEKALETKLRQDVESVKAHIVDMIRENGLSGYTLYFYIVPFNDAPAENAGIIKSIVTWED